MGDGSARSVEQAEAHAPAGYLGHIVLQEYLEAETLVGGARKPSQIVAENVLLGLHVRDASPRLQPRCKVAIDAQAGTSGIAHRLKVGVVADAKVVDGVWHQIGDVFVVEVGCEAEGFVPDVEVPVGCGGGLVGALRRQVGTERAVSPSQLAIHIGLLIHPCSELVEYVGTPVRFVACRKTR